MNLPTTDAQIVFKNRVPCEFCNLTIDRTARSTFQFLSGWARVNRRGGQNGLSLADYSPRFACSECLDRLKNNIAIGQGNLF